MFTGLIEEVGLVADARTSDACAQLRIAAPRLAKHAKIGDSIAVNGCCLTVAARRAHHLTFDLLEETMTRTNLKLLQREDRVNLERALSAAGRVGGHFVQGHIDCVAGIVSFQKKRSSDLRLEIELPAEFAPYVTRKGSIAVNGISLTVADVLTSTFAVWIIPYTKRHTNLRDAKAGDLVNVEFDVLAKYVERMLQRTPSSRPRKTTTDRFRIGHKR
jgi:riboflavin synthase